MASISLSEEDLFLDDTNDCGYGMFDIELTFDKTENKSSIEDEKLVTVINDTVINNTVINDTVINDTVINDTVINDTVINDTVINDTVINDNNRDNDNNDNSDNDNSDDDNDNEIADNTKDEIIVKKVYKTDEEYKNDSRISTHESLINLGKNIATDEINDKIQKEELCKLIEFFKKISDNCDIKVSTMIKEKSKPEIIQIIDNSNRYIELNNFKIDSLQTNNIKLKEENAELCCDIKQLIIEHDNLENYMEDRTKYYENRILNLRNKCLYKNRIQKILILTVFATNLFNVMNTTYIMNYGLDIYIYNCSYIVMNCINFFYFMFYFTFYYSYFIINLFYEYFYYLIPLLMYHSKSYYTELCVYSNNIIETLKYNSSVSNFFSNNFSVSNLFSNNSSVFNVECE